MFSALLQLFNHRKPSFFEAFTCRFLCIGLSNGEVLRKKCFGYGVSRKEFKISHGRLIVKNETLLSILSVTTSETDVKRIKNEDIDVLSESEL